jgi:ABC-type Fe3+ transport system substrate-binding protein
MWAQLRLFKVIGLVVAAVLGVAATGCGSSDDATSTSTSAASGATATKALPQTPEFKRVLAAANKEGTLNLNWGFSMGDASPLVDAFHKNYPNIKVTVTPSQDQPANLAKLLQELQAGKRSSTDAFVGVPQLLWAAGPQQANALERVDWEALAPWTKGLATSDSVGLSLFDQYSTFAYNTSQFDESELPTSAADVLKLKQPVASTPYAALFNVLAVPEAMGEQGLERYLAAFRPAGFIGCGDLSRVASGEFAALWINCGANVTEIFAAKGAPLKNAVIKDATATYPWYGAVPKNSAHPNAAKIWVVWLDSPEAQQLLIEHEKADNRRIKGSTTAKQLSEYEAQGVKFVDADYEFVSKHPEVYTRAYSGKLIGILTKKK